MRNLIFIKINIKKQPISPFNDKKTLNKNYQTSYNQSYEYINQFYPKRNRSFVVNF